MSGEIPKYPLVLAESGPFRLVAGIRDSRSGPTYSEWGLDVEVRLDGRSPPDTQWMPCSHMSNGLLQRSVLHLAVKLLLGREDLPDPAEALALWRARQPADLTKMTDEQAEMLP